MTKGWTGSCLISKKASPERVSSLLPSANADGYWTLLPAFSHNFEPSGNSMKEREPYFDTSSFATTGVVERRIVFFPVLFPEYRRKPAIIRTMTEAAASIHPHFLLSLYGR